MLQEIRSTFLSDRCQCGGKIYRHIVHGFVNHGDDGNQLLATKVHDRCSDCKTIEPKPGTAFHPASNELNRLFTLWESGQLSRQQFDEEINHALNGGDPLKNTRTG